MTKTRKFLVLGANGMLGWAVSKYFKKNGYGVTEITRKEFDIANEPIAKLHKYIKACDAVINCAGVIKPQIEKNSVEDVLKTNGVFPWNLAKVCLANRKKCIHITTDCVFSGKKGKYDENDLVDVDDLYGLSKNMGDTNLCMTLRTSIIGEEKNRQRSLVEWIRANRGKEINGFTNHQWNGVTTVYLAEIIEKILNKKLYKPGVYHVYSPTPVNKYQLLSMVSKIYNLGCRVNKTKAPQKIDRSLSTIHDLCSKVVRKSLKEQIVEMREFFTKIR